MYLRYPSGHGQSEAGTGAFEFDERLEYVRHYGIWNVLLHLVFDDDPVFGVSDYYLRSVFRMQEGVFEKRS